MRYRFSGSFVSILLLTAVVQAFSGDAKFFERGWQHVSETSAVIYWQLGDISSSATSYVEYGRTESLGEQTPQTGKPRWSQFHRLQGLQSGVTYYYRMVVEDPQTGQKSESEILTLTTRKREGAVYVPGELAGPPYILEEPDGYYILTEDITTDGSAFVIAASGVTLDLDGHTVTFGENTVEQVYGVRFTNQGKGTLCNGHLAQGRNSGDYSAAIASLEHPEPVEVFGVSTDVHLKCAYPLHFTHASKARIHHNHLYSRVTELESRHYPGNTLLRVVIYGGDIHIHDNLLTEGCHWGISLREKSTVIRNVEVDHNDICHHQQYVNGYAISPCQKADVHHNKINSTGRGAHLTRDGILFHDNYLVTQGHMHLSDLPARTRPFKHRYIELHGVKFEGSRVKNCKVYNNFVKITQWPPRDSGGRGAVEDKMENGVYVRSTASSAGPDRLVDSSRNWEADRWKDYYVSYSSELPPARITGNDATALYGEFKQAAPSAEYTIYMKWEYVPPTPLNIACYDPNAMNEVYNNRFIAVTHYKQTRHGGYGDTGQWASPVMFIGMNRGASEPGKYAIYVHDNQFVSNDLFLNGNAEVTMNVRLENNTFTLVKNPVLTERKSRFHEVIGPAIVEKAEQGKNVFNY